MIMWRMSSRLIHREFFSNPMTLRFHHVKAEGQVHSVLVGGAKTYVMCVDQSERMN